MRTALVVLTASVAVLSFGAVRASAVPAASATATSSCWMAVVNDWLDNNRVDRTYAIPCYTQAIQHLNAYPDVQNYSSAVDDIHTALLAAIRQDRGTGPGGDGTSGGSEPGGQNGPGGGPTNPSGGGGTGSGRGILGSLTPSNAQSIPLPLIVLAVLALLLLAAAAATWFARRFQARRVSPPRPAPAPAIDKRR